jgi:acetyl esterase/lipase
MRQATARTASSARRATASWLVAAVTCCAAAFAGDPPRDWSRVALAWRDDPRAAGDVPAGDAVQPHRPSRRAVRRAARRGLSLDDLPVGVQRPAAPGSLDGIVPQTEPTGPAIHAGRQPPISVAATLTSPFTADEAVLAHRDQPYGGHDDARRRFDIHLPGACATGSLPLVVWIAGDDWQGGSRADCPLVWLVERGYAVASIDYRPCTAAPFPAQLDDCRAALATLLGEAETWGVDPGRICVVGRGAGGHLAALVALADPPAEQAVPPVEVAAACAVAAPAHLPSLAPAERTAAAAGRLVGGPLVEFREAAQAASPLAHVSADDPPVLLVHGDRDTEVPATQAVGLDRALKAAGTDSRLVLLDAAGHAVPLTVDSDGGAAVLEFLDAVLGAGARETPPAATRSAAPPGR